MSDRVTLLDIYKAQDPDGARAQAAEVLEEQNPFMVDAPAYPTNAPAGNRVTLRSSLPSVSFTKINKGTPRSKSSYRQRVDTMGILAGRSEVDVKQKIVVGESKFQAHRAGEDDAFAESMSQTMAETLIYGDEAANEAAFTGLQPRLETLNDGSDLTTSRVISAGGAGSDNSSIYVLDWHERYVHLIYPEESSSGLEVKDLGELPVNDADGYAFQAEVTSYTWATGVTVKDPRHIGRLANIDVSDLADAGKESYAGPDLINLMIDLLSAMPNPGGAQRMIYASNVVWAALHKIALDKKNAALTMQNYMNRFKGGDSVGLFPHFWEYPIRRVDRISNTEDVVS